ncbi:MAG: hypothetical protein H6745_16400 [Deltaproteobacteria bacterium]|nr:hypothetical protein [Deltaproteobacteria bacterium]
MQISPPTVAGDLTAANPGRWSDGAVAPSCAGYATPADSSYCAGTDSGVYLVDPDGGSAQNAYAVTCDFAAGTETRLCAEGYTGAACDTPVCEQSCENGGACAAPDTCGCTAGWTGTTCEEPVCAPSCQNGGTCAAPGECDCTGTGYAGAQCQTVDVTCPTTAECPTTSYPDASGECVPFAPGPLT